MKNKLYWEYNIPLQLWPEHEDPEDEKSEIIGYRVLNYMPRKERCIFLSLEEVLGEQTKEEYFETAAVILENLAKQFREAKVDVNKVIYYPELMEAK